MVECQDIVAVSGAQVEVGERLGRSVRRIIFVRSGTDKPAARMSQEIKTSLYGQRSYIDGSSGELVYYRNEFEEFGGTFPCEVHFYVVGDARYDWIDFQPGDLVVCLTSNEELTDDFSLAFYRHRTPNWIAGRAHLTIQISTDRSVNFRNAANQTLSVLGRIHQITNLEMSTEQIVFYQQAERDFIQIEDLMNELNEVFWSDPSEQSIREKVGVLIDMVAEYTEEYGEVLATQIENQQLRNGIGQLQALVNELQSEQCEAYLRGDNEGFAWEHVSPLFNFFLEQRVMQEGFSELSLPKPPFSTTPRENTPAFYEFVRRVVRFPGGDQLLWYLAKEYDNDVEGVFSRSFFVLHALERTPRFMPVEGGMPNRVITLEEFDTLPEGQKGFYQQVVELPLSMIPDEQEIARLNETVEFCKAQDVPVVLYIPTCPADQHIYVEGKNSISWTGGSILPGISWPSMGAMEMVVPIIQKLTQEGVGVLTVFATGDMEYYSDQTRGMTETAFMRALSQTHITLAAVFQQRVGVSMQATAQMNGMTSVVEATSSEGISLLVNGIAEITGGKNSWLQLKEEAMRFASRFIEDPQNRDSIEELVEVRENIYRRRMENKGIDTSEANFFENALDEVRDDIVDYIAFHMLAARTWGQQVVMLTGDSYKLEALAVQIIRQYNLGNYAHIAAQGNYPGCQ